jgi:hypothetical protein
MVTSTGQAVFAVVAKDAATKTLNGVGKAFGGLKRGGIAALKGIATASVAAATALVGFGIAAVKSAADDERATFRLNAALRARGLLTEDLSKKIDQQITAMAELGFTDDDVRAGIETSSRFFKSQARILKVNSVAANIAAVTGKDLSTVITAIAKGAKGSTRGLLGFGIQVEKGAKLQDILRIATEKYGGAAQEIAQSTSGRFAAAQIKLNEAFEAFGYRFLPVVNDALTTFTNDILPQVERFLSDLGPVIDDLANNYIGPLVTSFDELAKTMGFEDGFGFLIGAIEVALTPLKVALSLIKGLLDGINEAFRIFNGLASSKTGALLSGNARTQYLSGGNLGTASPMGGTSSYLQTSIDFSIGTQKQDKLVSDSLIRQGTGRRGGY